MDYYGPMMNGYGGGFLMSLLWLAFFVLVAVLAYRVLKSRDVDSHAGSRSDPLDIAKARYAKGEIDKQEYERLKKDLSE